MARKFIPLAIPLLAVALLTVLDTGRPRPACGAGTLPRLQVSDNGRYLVQADGKPVFLLTDTAWGLARKLRRDDVRSYLRTRKRQGFNAVTFVAVGSNPAIAPTLGNDYGAAPFELGNGIPDPTRPLITRGDATGLAGEYDFWDHLDYCVDRAGEEGLYVVLLPTWGSWVVGEYAGGGGEPVFNERNAYVYGRFLGKRYRDRRHVLWMLGGDRAAVNGQRDSRPVFRAMARGLADGANGERSLEGPAAWESTLISYHPRKGAPQSSEWFHDDPWLDFNSVQEWPDRQLGWMEKDWSRTPVKPTWLFEGRYENYHKGGYKPSDWGSWQVRQQAYQTVFAGAFGHTYGSENVFGFGTEEPVAPSAPKPAPGTWQEHLQDAGALQMRHLARLMGSLSPREYLSRIPDPELVEGDPGKAERVKSDRLTATRGQDGDYALVYSAAGRPVSVRMSRLRGPALDAFWFDPRTGRYVAGSKSSTTPTAFQKRVLAGEGAPVRTFTPPTSGEGQDWVLVLRPGK